MALVGRRRSSDRASAGDADRAEPIEAAAPEVIEQQADVSDDDGYEPTTAFSRLRGPFDRSEVADRGDYLDLGGMWLPRLEGLELRLEVDQQTQTIIGVQLVQGRSMAQLQAFAAPRTAGLWAELRGEIAQGVLSQGGSAEVVDGALGKELRVLAPGGQAMRFLGVDGPRWFLRAVLNGPAASSESAAAPLVDIVRKVVVVRGSEAMPPREVLPLRLPEDAVPAEPPADPPSDRRAPRQEDLRPFERGPEITEVH